MINYLRGLTLGSKVRRRAEFYSEPPPDAERELTQLGLLNREWARMRREVPFFEALALKNGISEKFSSLQEFFDSAPITTKDMLQEDVQRFVSRSRKPDYVRRTGGTTAEPVHLPAWRSEVTHTTPDIWIGRGWYGIRPSDPLFLIWGHSHLLGTGIGRLVNQARRRSKDWLLGYHRFPAYNMNRDSMRAAADRLLRSGAQYVIGYSVALDHFARVNEDRKHQLRELKLKAVIGTAEAFPHGDSAESIASLFGCPVAMEYGAAEASVMAHTNPAGRYTVFWKTYLIELAPTGQDTRYRALVTSLYPRCVPLVRYDIGDEVMVAEPQSGVAAYLDDVIGRSYDEVLLPNGSQVHSEAFTHAVKFEAAIAAYQVEQIGDSITLYLVPRGDVNEEVVGRVRQRLERIADGMGIVDVQVVPQLKQTVAGKTPMILRR
jgi:phenylacetate-CoA ligase